MFRQVWPPVRLLGACGGGGGGGFVQRCPAGLLDGEGGAREDTCTQGDSCFPVPCLATRVVGVVGGPVG